MEEYDLEEEEEEEEMARATAAGRGSAGRGAAGQGAAGRGTAAAAARRSPPRAVAGVDALVAGMANVQVADPPFRAFNFDAASISVLAETQTMSATGRQKCGWVLPYPQL